jgi:hypothetical protein
LGIDPLREEAKKNRLLNAVFAILYMAKIFLTGFTMKGEDLSFKFRAVQPCCAYMFYLIVDRSGVSLSLQ